ncbi:hypothetical protein HDV06_000783 [Boothiomyces sp. JEL0866]|nr:hypothetical protein HDV06_000783 [Boothiomyces sp. JEL0866]
MKFTLFATAALAASIKRSVAGPDDIAALNSLISGTLDGINQQIPTMIQNGHFDPLAVVAVGSTPPKPVNLGFCQADAEAGYTLTNLIGLHTLQIDHATVLSAIINDTTGNFAAEVQAAIKPVSIALDFSGFITSHCGLIHTKEALNGNVAIQSLDIALNANVFFDTSNGFAVDTATLEGIQITYGQIDVTFDGFAQIFNPLLEFITSHIQGRVKSQLLDQLDSLVKPFAQKAINAKLPIQLA